MSISLTDVFFVVCQVLGETAVDDYAEGDNEVYFSTDRSDITGIYEALYSTHSSHT